MTPPAPGMHTMWLSPTPYPADMTNSTLLSLDVTGMADPGADLSSGLLRIPAAGSFDFPQGAIITATFTAEIDSTAVGDQIITNTVGAVWTSIDGDADEERHGGGRRTRRL